MKALGRHLLLFALDALALYAAWYVVDDVNEILALHQDSSASVRHNSGLGILLFGLVLPYGHALLAIEHLKPSPTSRWWGIARRTPLVVLGALALAAFFVNGITRDHLSHIGYKVCDSETSDSSRFGTFRTYMRPPLPRRCAE